MKRLTLGIDPGRSGGLALLSADATPLLLARMPRVPGSPPRFDAAECARLVAVALDYAGTPGRLDAWCEEAQHVRIQGRLQAHPTAVLAECVALWRGLLAGRGVELHTVAPTTWQAGILAGAPGGTTKARALAVCRMRWPSVRVIQDGIADALLVAAYGREQRQCGRVT